MVTQVNDVVALTPAGFVVACSWCTPRPRLAQLARAYPAHVSHSICPACELRMVSQAAA